MADSPATPNGAIEAGDGGFIEGLLAGPDDAELSPRDMARLRAYLNQWVSLAQKRRDARAEGKSETAQRRKKLKRIYDFNRYLRAESPAAIESEPAEPSAAPSEADPAEELEKFRDRISPESRARLQALFKAKQGAIQEGMQEATRVSKLIFGRQVSPIVEGIGKTPEKPATDTKADAGEEVAHSTDFRSVRWFDERFSFTSNQAPVVKLLFENWHAGTPDVGDETLLLAVDPDAPPARLATLFRDHPAWGTMIVAGGSKGTHRIAERAEENP